MKITYTENFSSNFGSRKTFKKMFDKCAYSGEGFAPYDTRTIEHIIPVVKG